MSQDQSQGDLGQHAQTHHGQHENQDHQGDFPRSRQQAYDPQGGDQAGDIHYTGTASGGDRRTHTDQGNIPHGNEHHHDQHPEHVGEEGLTHEPPTGHREDDRRNEYGP